MIHDILGEIVNSTKAFRQVKATGTDKVEKKYKVQGLSYPGYIRLVDEQGQVKVEEQYKEAQLAH